MSFCATQTSTRASRPGAASRSASTAAQDFEDGEGSRLSTGTGVRRSSAAARTAADAEQEAPLSGRPLRPSKTAQENDKLLANGGKHQQPDSERELEDYEEEGGDGEESQHGGDQQGCSLLPHGGIIGSGFNLASATLGAGTLALPGAMAGSGYVLGSVLLIAVCLSTVFSVRLLTQVFESTGYPTYEKMAYHLVGPKFEKFTAALLVTFCWGITIVYVVALGDVLEKIGAGVTGWPERFQGTWGRHLMTIIFWACFLLPLSLLKEINSLRYTSVLGIMATIFLVIAIIVHEELDPNSARGQLEMARADVGMIASLPVFIFSYCCQTNTFEIYTEMRPRKVNRMSLSASLSMGIVTMIYIAAGVAGVANFGQKGTRGNILNNYDPFETAYITIAFIAITFTLTSAYPLCVFPTRDAIVQLMGYENAYKTPWQTRMLVCLVLAFLSLVAGIFAPGIQVLFGVLGGVCGSSISFIWPALFTLKRPGYSRESAGTLHYLAVWTLGIVGVIVAVLGTVLSIVDQATK